MFNQRVKNYYEKCLFIFDKRFKNGFIFTLFLSILLSLLEILGIGIFVPLFFSLTNSDHVIIEKLRYIHPLIDNNFNYFLLLSIFLIFFFKFY